MPLDDLSSVLPRLTRRQFVGSGCCLLGLAVRPSLARAVLTGDAPIWTVRKNGKSVYVLGESLPRPIDWHEPSVERLLSRCGHLWTETNQIYHVPVLSLAERYGISTATATLNQLSATQKARFQQAVAVANVLLSDLAGARPWLIGATLEEAGYQTAGLTGKSANTILSEVAAKANIPVSSEFATKDEVFAWFGAMSPVQEIQFLCFVVDGVLLGRAGTEQISSSWLSGHAGPATDFVNHERQAYPALYARLTAERNRAWVPQFEMMLRNPKPTMVVVGLYHLVGPDSLLVQARKAGFEVVRGLYGNGAAAQN